MLGMFCGINAARLGPFAQDGGALVLILPFLIYAPCAVLDFLLLRAPLPPRAWVEDEAMARTFD